jgi:hypothetical protein
MNIGILLISTWKYNKFIDLIISDIKKYFIVNHSINIYLHTDSDKKHDATKTINIKHETWPLITLKKFHIFYDNRDIYKNCDYLFSLDIDCTIVDYISDDIISDFCVVRNHYHINNKYGPLENNKLSTAYISNKNLIMKYNYIAGGFFGGSYKRFIDVSKQLMTNIDLDSENNIIARLHDESHLNKYWSENSNSIKLLPSQYMYFNHLQQLPNPKIITKTPKESQILKKDL